MSATSQGFVHYFEARFLHLHGQGGNPKSWAERLPDFIRQDFQVPKHITMKTAEPLLMGCRKCGLESPTVNPHGAVHFLDAHRYCGKLEMPVWTCSKCGTLEDPTHPTCRFCETRRPQTLPKTGMEKVITVMIQEKRFFVEREGRIAGEITAGSLREVLRAVRGWYPNETVSIRCEGIGTWTTNHACK